MQAECFLCKQYGIVNRHHIFGGSNRRKSEKYGLVVNLCPKCHNEPPNGVHHNKDVMGQLHKYGQKKAMAEQGWAVDDFRREFHANYI